MRKLHTTKLINRPEMKFYLVIDYMLPSTWLKSFQAKIQNDGTVLVYRYTGEFLLFSYPYMELWRSSLMFVPLCTGTRGHNQNDGGRLGLVISLKTRSCLSHMIKRESLMFSLRQYWLDFLICTKKDSKFHFSPTFTSNLFFSIHEFAHRALWFLPFCLLPGAIHWTVHHLLVFVCTFSYDPLTSFFDVFH